MSSCVECFFYSGLEGKTLQILADRQHPNFACEGQTCSPYSPGPVRNDEEVGFLVIDPTHIDRDRGVITPDAFGELTTRDLSVLRFSVSSRQEANETRAALIERGSQKTPPELRHIDEVCVASVETIRKAELDGRRVLAVYDTALSDKPGHASVFTHEVGLTSGKKMRKQIRAICHSIFRTRIISFEEFQSRLTS